MIYSIGKNLGTKLTGIEQAMINRLKLFKDNLVPNKLIFTSWSPRLYMHAHSLNIDSKDIFSLYDFLQDSINFEKKHIDWINYWQNVCNYTLKFVENTNDIKIYDNDTYKMYVHFVDSNYQTLDYINHFDIQQRKIRRDFYDTRGFLSCSRILTSQQKVVMEQFFTPTQKVKFQKYYNPEHEHPSVLLSLDVVEDEFKLSFKDGLFFSVESCCVVEVSGVSVIDSSLTVGASACFGLVDSFVTTASLVLGLETSLVVGASTFFTSVALFTFVVSSELCDPLSKST